MSDFNVIPFSLRCEYKCKVTYTEPVIICPYIPITHVRVMSGNWDEEVGKAVDRMANEIFQKENKLIINSIIDSIGSSL